MPVIGYQQGREQRQVAADQFAGGFVGMDGRQMSGRPQGIVRLEKFNETNWIRRRTNLVEIIECVLKN